LEAIREHLELFYLKEEEEELEAIGWAASLEEASSSEIS